MHRVVLLIDFWHFLMNKRLILLFVLGYSLISGAQDLRHYELLYRKPDTLNHSSVITSPFDALNTPQNETLKPLETLKPSVTLKPLETLKQPFLSWLYTKTFFDPFIILNKPDIYLSADPLFDAEIGRDNHGPTWVNTRGFQVYGKINLGKKVEMVESVELVEPFPSPPQPLSPFPPHPLTPFPPQPLSPSSPVLSFYSNYYESQSRPPLYLDSIASFAGGIPGQGSYLDFGNVYDHSYATAWVKYQARKFFTFELGTGKNFFGNGYRSMLLSDNARNYPYFRIDTRFWRINYTNLWAEFQDNNYHDGPFGSYQKKYGAFHYLSYSVTNRLEISLFEAIIWQGRDSLHTRGFEFSYLNPVIFLRPVEWTLGSPDNALIGLNANYRFFNNTYLYGQLLLDDFPISHIIARDGFWGNKIAGQLGGKTFIPFRDTGRETRDDLDSASRVTRHASRLQSRVTRHDLRGIFLQSELNFARPYSYSHWTTKQNYGHISQPLAHPLGANFYEWVSFARLHWDRLLLEGRYSYAKFGANYDGLNYGQDIFQSFETRVNELGNFIGQGLPTTLTYTSFTFSFLLNPSSLLNIFTTLTLRQQNDVHTTWVTVGVRNSLRNLYTDF